MGECLEISDVVWNEFQRIIQRITMVSKEASNLVSVAESSQIFSETHKELLAQSKDAILHARHNEKLLKDFYYELSIQFKPLRKLWIRASMIHQITHTICNQVYCSLSEYVEKELPLFISKVKETGNHHRIQVGKLIWKEDNSVLIIQNEELNKQPRIYLSNNITSIDCKAALDPPCDLHKKKNSNTTLKHLNEVFDFTSQVFANINNLSKTLLYIKLSLEKFAKCLIDLKKSMDAKLVYYKSPFDRIKPNISSLLYRLVEKFNKIEKTLSEESGRLETYISLLPHQIISSVNTCIPIPPMTNEKGAKIELVQKVSTQISFIIKFIKLLLSVSEPRSGESSETTSLIIKIFHLRSIMLKKYQPEVILSKLTISVNSLQRNLEDFPQLKNFIPANKKLYRHRNASNINIKKSISSDINTMHSYESSWDISSEKSEEDAGILLSDRRNAFQHSISLRRPAKIQSKTPDLTILTGDSTRKSNKRITFTEEPKTAVIDTQIIRLPSLHIANPQQKASAASVLTHDTNQREIAFLEQMKKLRNNNAGFLSHRIKRIQENKSISPLTKIEYIREEFSNQFKPLKTKLKNSFLKIKGKNTYLYTMR